jgi:hypothetical protein
MVLRSYLNYRRATDDRLREHVAAAFNFQLTYWSILLAGLSLVQVAVPEDWRIIPMMFFFGAILVLGAISRRAARRVYKGEQPGYPPSIPFLRPWRTRLRQPVGKPSTE